MRFHMSLRDESFLISPGQDELASPPLDWDENFLTSCRQIFDIIQVKSCFNFTFRRSPGIRFRALIFSSILEVKGIISIQKSALTKETFNWFLIYVEENIKDETGSIILL